MATHPYADRYPVLRGMPSEGRNHDAIMAELHEMATAEDRAWESGGASGSFYCGDHDHYDFLNEAFGLYSHMNALQRDVCPSSTRFEGEIIAMGLDLFHGDDARAAGFDPVGMVTSGGSGSILHAVLSYRDHALHTRGITQPNVVKPETAHPAFDKACHLLGVELRVVPVGDGTLVDSEVVRAHMDDNTIALIASAGNYPYGTIDPIAAIGQLALAAGVGLHVDGCLGGLLLPFGEELGYNVTPFDFRVPGVTSISADTHKYGYSLKGTSLLLFRDRALRNAQYFFQTNWTGGKYCSPGIDGSRSSGLLAATWASMVALGRSGYRSYASEIFATAMAMQDAVRAHSELRILGDPTFLFAFTSEVFDVYHVNDELRRRGWRLNGLQYPNALHFCVTRPQTKEGVVQRWIDDLGAAVTYAKGQGDKPAKSGAIYGGVSGGWSDEADSFIRSIMSDMMDGHQSIPS
jgi:sphinganine-1-phosphate aldolase